LTSTATIVAPAATKPRDPSRETATARPGPGSASRATTRSELMSTNVNSALCVATSATRACAIAGVTPIATSATATVPSFRPVSTT